MKKLFCLLILFTCLGIVSCGTPVNETANSIEFTQYDSICFEKMDLQEKYQQSVVDKFLVMKYGKDKMKWYDSTHAVYMVLDSLEHEDMVKSIIKQASIGT